jgi:hypothetical protein
MEVKMKRKRFRTRLFIASITLAVLGSLFLVVASPFALGSLSSFKSNWTLLSNIGQTYGAVSALLAAIGLSGVAATITLQIQETRRSRADSIRARHYELYKAAMDDPDLRETSYSTSEVPSLKEQKQTIYINLQLQFWLMLWEIGNLPEDDLRLYAADLLKTEIGRGYWRRFGWARVNFESSSRKEKQFFQIMDEEYRRLAAVGQEHRLEATSKTGKRTRTPVIASMLIGLAAGTVLGRSINMRIISARNRQAPRSVRLRGRR